MGGIGEAVAGPVVGGLVGKMFGGGGGGGGDTGGYAPPGMGPEWDEINKLTSQKIKGFMTSPPPKLTPQAYSNPSVTVGGNKLTFGASNPMGTPGGFNPMNTLLNAGMGIAGFLPPNLMQNASPQQPQPKTQPQPQPAQATQPGANLKPGMGVGPFASPEVQQVYQSTPQARQQGFVANGNFFPGVGAGGTNGINDRNWKQAGAPWVDANGQKWVQVAHTGGQSGPRTVPYVGDIPGQQTTPQQVQQPAQQALAQPPQQQPGMSINLPSAPNVVAPYSDNVGYQRLASVGMLPNVYESSYGGYTPLTEETAYGGYDPTAFNQDQNIARVSDALKTGDFSKIPNELEGLAVQMIKSNMNAKNDEYNQYVQGLISQGMDPLKEAFDAAARDKFRMAARTGLSNTSQPYAEVYGDQAGSLSRDFANRSKELMANAALQGFQMAEAKRQGGLGQAIDVSGRQIQEDMARTQGNLDREIQQRNLIAQGIGLSTNQAQLDQASKMDWQRRLDELRQANIGQRMDLAKMADTRSLANQDVATKQAQLEQQRAMQDESNRVDWAKVIQAQRENQFNQEMAKYGAEFGTGQFLLNREDQLARQRYLDDLNLQEKNIGYEQDLSNPLNYLARAGAGAQMANENYWNSVDASRRDEERQAADLESLVGGFGSLFNAGKKSVTVADPYATSTFDPNRYKLQLSGNTPASRYQY